MIGRKTLIQHVVENEFKSLINDNAVMYESVDIPLKNQDGSFLLEVNSASQAFNDMLEDNYLKKISNYSRVSPETYLDQLGNKIIKIQEKHSLKEAIQLVYDTKKLVGGKFAGAIFKLPNANGLINPFHPLVALELLRGYAPETIEQIYIFTYDNLAAIDTMYNTENLSPEVFTSDINKLMQVYQSRVTERGVKILSNEVDMDSKVITQRYQVSKYSNESHNKEYYLAVHQLLTKSTFVPYYGATLISMNGQTSGFHITPCKSCNINRHTENGSSSVCTGSTSNTTVPGLRTLHHANLNSPYEKNCMTNASKPYMDACIQQAIKVYKIAEIIKD